MIPTDDLCKELCLLLGEAAPPTGRFSQNEIDYLLGKSQDVCEAAARGWEMKADKLIEAGALLQGVTIGSESYKFASIQELESYCRRKSAIYRKQSSSSAYDTSVGTILSMPRPSIAGLVLPSEEDDE